MTADPKDHVVVYSSAGGTSYYWALKQDLIAAHPWRDVIARDLTREQAKALIRLMNSGATDDTN